MEHGNSHDASLWRSNAEDCVWAIYDDDCVVFHRPSGKTHFLNAAGYRLLNVILETPERTSVIAAKLSGSVGGGPSTLDEGEVHAMLVRFEYLGLVDRSVPRS